MAGAGRPPRALYLHVPFCLSVCPYCDFVVYAGRAARGDDNGLAVFVEAALVEISLRAEAARAQFGPLPGLTSLYIGGGTPSLLSATQIGRLIDAVAREFGLAAGAELTLEANPGPSERGDLAGLRATGLNRLSVGAQSMARTELRRLGRRHSPADVRATVQAARAAGFDTVSVDLLYDIPGQTVDTWRATLAAVLALEPEHVSAYALDVGGPAQTADHLPASRGALRWRARAASEQDEDRAAAAYELADELLGRAGLRWYEISNWARPGDESRHNVGYWRWLPYEAVGPGAHAFDGARTRRWNAARLDAYLAALLAVPARLPDGGIETMDAATAQAERALLALRTPDGLSGGDCRRPAFASALAWGRAAGLLEPSPSGGVRLTMRGRLLASEVFWRLLPGSAASADTAA